ncbi:uncharacterized protein LOC132556319 [Ylistrum balloti]|uniref:uncharacterized protein LOC132556319 n=1 Tax=Ylistrum balloti TaxID=509963 RepID=UPI002905CE63|nr:uncharacterized protein LOC132556319 [Ylistrum balloti]
MSGQGIVVIDLGTGSVKAGLKGDSSPTCVLTAKQQKGVLNGGYPVEKGLVTNWEGAEQLLRNTFTALGVKPEEYTILLCQPMTNTELNKQKIVQVLFERFNVPAVFLAYTNVLSLYCTGKLNGVVMESGAGVSNCVAIYQGYAMLDSVVSSDLTGNQLTAFVAQKLNHPGIDFETVDEIKKNTCSLGPSAEVKSYTLPDGSSIAVNQDAQRAPEILLDPTIANLDTRSIPQTIVDCIEKVRAKHGEDRARELYGNIILSGENFLFSGIADRVQDEIKSKMAGVSGISVTKAAPCSAWIAGSILASHETFDGLLLTKALYEEKGIQSIEGKF